MAQTADTKLSSSQEGLSTIAKWIIFAVVAVVIVVIIGVILYFVFGGSKTPPPPGETKEQKVRELEREVALKREALKSKGSVGEVKDLERMESPKDMFEKVESESNAKSGLSTKFSKLVDKYGPMAKKYAARFASSE